MLHRTTWMGKGFQRGDSYGLLPALVRRFEWLGEFFSKGEPHLLTDA